MTELEKKLLEQIRVMDDRQSKERTILAAQLLELVDHVNVLSDQYDNIAQQLRELSE